MGSTNVIPSSRSPGRITRRPQARHGLSVDGRWLYVNTEAIDLGTVSRFKAHGLSEKDLSTGFATIAIFSAVAAAMIFGVVETGWRAKYMLEGALFGAIAICAVAELFSARRQTLFTFEISLADGRLITFVTANRDEAERLNAALQTNGATVS